MVVSGDIALAVKGEFIFGIRSEFSDFTRDHSDSRIIEPVSLFFLLIFDASRVTPL